MEKMSDLAIEALSPEKLREDDFVQLNEVTQDMWAYGIGEFVQCTSCSEMHSKQDVFWGLSKGVYEMTVAQIMRVLNMNDILCPWCGEKTEFVFWENNIANIKERLLNSEESFLVVCREKEEGKIIGYVDGYIDSLETIFARELHYHYSDVWFEAVKNQVARVLGYVPPSLISFSSMWLVEKHSNFFTIFNMLRTFFYSIPESRREIAGITELDRGNVLYKIYTAVGSRSLGIDTIPEYRWKIRNTGKDYQSDIVVWANPIAQAVEKFTTGVRWFLRSSQNTCKERKERSSLVVTV